MTKKTNSVDLLAFVENVKSQWMATIDALIDPLMIVNKDYIIEKANKAMAKHAGRHVKDVVGKKCYEVFANRKSPCPGCQMKKAEQGGEHINYQMSEINDGKFYEVTSQPLIDADQNIQGVVQIYRDRTEAKHLEEQLAQHEKLASIGLLAGGIAHEINNPLGGILIFSQMLLKEIPQNSPHYQDVVEIEAATQRCKAIVESLLDFARQRPIDPRKHREQIDINDALRTALRFGKVSIKNQSLINIEEHIDHLSHPFTGERNKIIQVFLNLIQNAVQAMPDGGSLTIVSERQVKDGKDYGIYKVSDTGVGIPNEYLKKIFDPFFTTKDPGEGTGLGLAICYGIVDDLGGELSVKSKINHGTTFTVSLPLAMDNPKVQAGPKAS